MVAVAETPTADTDVAHELGSASLERNRKALVQ